MDLAEYFIDEQDVMEWLPWGGLVRPSVVRNKDYSFFGVISYDRLSIHVPLLVLPRGWSIWTEEQHKEEATSRFFVVGWNPFWSTLGDESENALQNRKIVKRKAPDYFAEELSRIADKIRDSDASCRVLEYQDIVDFLAFSLSFGGKSVDMPSIPLYLDFLLTEGLGIEFMENDISILGKKVVVLSLPSCPRGELLESIRREFADIPYRYVRRILCMNESEAGNIMKEYTKSWCSSRAYMKRAIMDGTVLPMSGYYSEQIIFSLAEGSFDFGLRYIRNCLDALCVPYILENFNLKDCWWGSLAGCFRANIRPIVTGFEELSDFLIQPSGERSAAYVQA